MDATEYGAYVRIFLACYQTKDHTLPNDDIQLSRIARCTLGVWNRIKHAILVKFIIVNDGDGMEYLVHEGVFRNIIKYRCKSAKNKANRLKGLETKQPLVNQTATKPQPSSDNTRPKTKDQRTEEEITPISPTESEMYFTQVWAAYPGRGKRGATGAAFKGSKSDAFARFQVLLKKERDYDGFTKQLIAGAHLYTHFLDQSGYPSKHLSTWLNQQCWKDDYSSTPGSDGGHSHAEVVTEGFRRALFPDGGEE